MAMALAALAVWLPEALLVWVEGASWGRPGAVCWRLFDAKGKPGEAGRAEERMPAWSKPAAVRAGDGRFVILY
jgi:hypothetical protein